MKPEELTAWVLNELGPTDAARVEATVAATPELTNHAVDTRGFCTLLTEHLGSGEGTLTSDQRLALLAHVSRHAATAPNASNALNSPSAFHAPEAARQRDDLRERPRPSFTRHPVFLGLAAAAASWVIYWGVRVVPMATARADALVSIEARPLSEQVMVQQGKADAGKGLADAAQQRSQQGQARRPGDGEARELLAKINTTVKAFRDPNALPKSLPLPTDTLVLKATALPKPVASVVAVAAPVTTQSGSMATRPQPAASAAASAAVLPPVSGSASAVPSTNSLRLGGGFNPNQLKRIDRVDGGAEAFAATRGGDVPLHEGAVLLAPGLPVTEGGLAAPQLGLRDSAAPGSVSLGGSFRSGGAAIGMGEALVPGLVVREFHDLAVDPETGLVNPLAVPVTVPLLRIPQGAFDRDNPGRFSELGEGTAGDDRPAVGPLGKGFWLR